MKNTEKLQNKLEKKYKAILDISKDKINFGFFVAISDYVRAINKNDLMKEKADIKSRLDQIEKKIEELV